MKFSDALANEMATFRKGPVCTVTVILSQLEKDDRAALEAALATDTPHAFITRALNNVGYKVQANAVARHRRKECSCG